MPWHNNRSQQAAIDLFQSHIQVKEELARLQEQQSADQERFKEFRYAITELRELIRQLEQGQRSLSEVLSRVEYLETKLSTFGADFTREYLHREEFVDYQESVLQKEEEARLAKALAEAEQIKSTRKQWGAWAAAFLGGCVAIAPKLWEFILWVVQKVWG